MTKPGVPRKKCLSKPNRLHSTTTHVPAPKPNLVPEGVCKPEVFGLLRSNKEHAYNLSTLGPSGFIVNPKKQIKYVTITKHSCVEINQTTSTSVTFIYYHQDGGKLFLVSRFQNEEGVLTNKYTLLEEPLESQIDEYHKYLSDI